MRRQFLLALTACLTAPIGKLFAFKEPCWNCGRASRFHQKFYYRHPEYPYEKPIPATVECPGCGVASHFREGPLPEGAPWDTDHLYLFENSNLLQQLMAAEKKLRLLV